MKPIIIDMVEMSDSTEVYGNRPSPILSGVMYCLGALLVVAAIWMNFFEIDEVVRSSGMVKSNSATATISSVSSGKIVNYAMEDDSYIEEGTVLLELDTTEAQMQREVIVSELEDLENKVAILEAYICQLDGTKKSLSSQKENPYYAQYENRYALVQSNCTAIGLETQGLKNQYTTNIQNLDFAIASSQAEEGKLTQMLDSVKTRSNAFGTADLYYYSTVDSYINTYNSTAASYDTEIQKLRDAVTDANNYSQEIADLEQQKATALLSQEQKMVASIEQSILTSQANTTDMSASRNLAQSELNSINSGQEAVSKEQIIRNEKAAIYSELNTCLAQKKEYEYNLQNLDYAIEQGQVVAQCSGYLNLYQENTVGDYVAGGSQLGTIVPAGDGIYKVQIYLDNQDIGKIKEETEVKYEIAAYPSSAYGQATGIITKISEDLKINQDTGKGYYLAEATIILPKNGDDMELKQGMAVEAKVVVGQKTVMNYLLEKLDLLFDIS